MRVPRPIFLLSLAIDRIGFTIFFLAGTGYALYLQYVIEAHYEAAVFFTALVATVGVVGVLKVLTRVERPASGLVRERHMHRAFPSGHTASAAFIATFFVQSIDGWHTLVGGAALVVLVGASRLVLRAHTLSQVVAGAIIGTTVPLSIIWILGRVL